jgi:hypothetical protein
MSDFVVALASGDPAEIDQAEQMAEPGSPARAFVEMVSETVGRLSEQRVELPRPSVPTRGPNGSWRSCAPGSSCVSFIPKSVDLDALGFTLEAKAVARALQDYGAYVVDRAGGGTVAIYAEPTVPPGWYSTVTGPAWSGQQLALIRSLLTIVGNSGPASIGGGGARPLPLAP